jgi:hypothetical protein
MMNNLETIMHGRPFLVNIAMIEHLVLHRCPQEFDLPAISNCSKERNCETCWKCWKDALNN